MLIGSDGHIRVTDFGFAKKIEDKTYTLCGTPEYIAPEVILGNGHNHGADWWSFGVIMFEMLSGYSPFYDTSSMEIYKRIINGYFECPDAIDDPAKSLIGKLLEKDITRRYGC